MQWQDWMRNNTSLSNFNNYCSSSELGAGPKAGKISINPQNSHKMILLLTSKPQKKHINRPCSIMGGKYQKLCSNFKQIFPSKKVISVLRTGCATKSDCWFLGGWLHFETVACANSITPPRRSPMVASKQHFKSSRVDNLQFTPRCRYFSLWK